MDWVEYLTELVQSAGVIGAMALISMSGMILIVIMFLRQERESNIKIVAALKEMSKAIELVIDKVSVPYLQTGQSIMLFRSVMRDHIWQKLTYLGEILERNSLADRKPQIKRNIEREFRRITVQESEKLSLYKSVCGDMGKILQDSIDWKEFLVPVFAIFFSQDTDAQRIKDIHVLMTCEVDKIVKIIEGNGLCN
jgi:hypothetical protein